MWVLDFETEAIVGNTSKFPPKPVGLAYRTPDGESDYTTEWAWMANILSNAWKENMLFHHSKFDVSVAMKWFSLPFPRNPLNVHDTQFLIFLHDPHAASLSLKPSAERILGEPPEERDELRDWILRNVPGATKKEWGAHISKAPVELVRPYALGDVGRTWRLFRTLHPIIVEKGMEEAYQREQLLMPILYEAELRGLRVDIDRLSGDIDKMDAAVKTADSRIFSILGSTFNVESSDELAQALDAAGAVKEWQLTPTGRRSMAKGALTSGVTNPELLALLLYRGGMATCLNTFGIPWYNQAIACEGRVHPTWNQVRQEGYGGESSFKGTRTGRLSCDHPNLTNPPTEMKAKAPSEFMEIPLMRQYLLPEEGHLWLKRDFSSQEIRILAHYEDGGLMKAYNGNPKLDPHLMAQEMIQEITGIRLERKDVKIVGFSIIYGAGVTGLAQQLGTDYGRAQNIREAYMAALPGIRILGDALRNRGRNGTPMRTWGGRLYLPEPPRLVGGIMRSFEYKLLNYLIQGSAADQTKQAVIDWHATKLDDNYFLIAMHDEIDISAPEKTWEAGMQHLKEVMNHPRFDVPMLSEGFWGHNFGELNELDA
jgi:DNA polymerase-1